MILIRKKVSLVVLGKKKKLNNVKKVVKESNAEDPEIEEEMNQIIMEEAEDDKSSSFSFEEDSSQNSESLTSQTSTDLSSTQDEFARQVPEIAVSDDVKEKISKKVKKLKKKETDIKFSDPRGVVYIGRLPYGFFEDQLRGFFSQFGIVTRLRVSRNKKTGNPKHYCFIEFLDPIVATIVADTMDGYIMFEKSLKCKVIPPEKVHPKTFNGANRRFFPKRTRITHRKLHNTPKTEKQINKLVSKEKKKREKIQNLGINYDFPGYSSAKNEGVEAVKESDK